MITKELIDRINYLAKKQKEGTLTEDEKQEQANLRQQYIKAFRQRLKHTLDGVEYVEDKDNPKH
jgi:uncharacterized protein YnzC (UPF0291/DUF896 family)